MKPAATLLVQMARESGRTVLSQWDLFLLARRLFRDRGYRDTPLPPRNRNLTAKRARALLEEATIVEDHFGSRTAANGQLQRDRDFASLLFVARNGSATDALMDADPSAISHTRVR